MTNMRTVSMTRRGGARQIGFTLIEILIVVAIIAVIGGIVANRIFGGADKAKWRLAQAQIQTLAGKIEGYELDNGNPPEQLQDMVREPGNAPGWLGPYAKEAELKDPWNRPIDYRVPGESGKYDLVSYGADGKPGGDSWNKDIRND